jgi:hypothetical protein
MTRTFRLVFITSSAVRLHTKPADLPMTWNFPWVIDGEEVHVLTRDRIDSSRGYPQHLGLEVQVHLPAASLEEALEKAHKLASLHLTLISAVGRAPTGSPMPVLAYETTPEADERDFRQWHGPLPLPVGKTPIPDPPFREFFEAYVTTSRDPSIHYPILMSMQLYSAALREIEPVLRFMLFWPACEAMESSLRRKLDRTPKDSLWGLKGLAERHGETADLIIDAYQLRNDIFHVRGGVDASTIPARAQSIGDRLEPIIGPGICLLLDLDVAAVEAQLPAQAASAHPVQLIFTATMRGDPGQWNADSHPHVEINFEVVPVQTDADGSINFKAPSSFTVRNCEQMTPRSTEVRGPFGPNIGRMGLDETEVVRSEGTSSE